jgi:hypothetical protein
MCNKISYASEREANAVINSFYRRRKRVHYGAKLPKRSYKCDKCGMWHLTSLADYREYGEE